MSDTVSLDLDAIADPTFTIRFAGETKQLDPFAVLEKVRAVAVDPGDDKFVSQMDAARQAFGFPTVAEAEKAGVQTPSVNQTLSLIDRFAAYLETEVKPLGNLLGRTQSLSLGASAPASLTPSQEPTEPSSSAA